MSDKYCQGLSLIELLMILSVAAILAATAVPAFYNLIGKQRLKGAAETLFSDLQFARFTAIKKNTPIGITFQTSQAASDWCYGLSDSGPCRCNQAGDCKIEGIPATTVTPKDFRKVTLKTNFFRSTTSFKPLKGTTNAGTAILTYGKNSIHVIVSTLGRIRSCSDSVSGYPPC